MASSDEGRKRKLLDLLDAGTQPLSTQQTRPALGPPRALQGARLWQDQPSEEQFLGSTPAVDQSGGFYRDPLNSGQAASNHAPQHAIPAPTPSSQHMQEDDDDFEIEGGEVLALIKHAIAQFPKCNATEGCIPFTLLTSLQVRTQQHAHCMVRTFEANDQLLVNTRRMCKVLLTVI